MGYAIGILVLRTHNTGCESDKGPMWFCDRECIDWAVRDGYVAADHDELPDMVTNGYWLCMQCNCALPVSEAAVDLLELAAQYLRVADDARNFVWKYEYDKAATVWRSPSPAPVDGDRVIVTALRWQDDRHLYAARCAEASIDWGIAQARYRDAEMYFADIKARLSLGQ